MNTVSIRTRTYLLLAALIACILANAAQAMIMTIRPAATPGGLEFNLSAKQGYILTPDGGAYYMWGYANGDGLMQYPGPTLEFNQGETVTIHLTNQLDVPVSMVFPGQLNVTAGGGTAGVLTNEAAPAGGMVSYTFTATHAGTYHYHSGTNPELQIEMGLFGAIIVRPDNQPAEETWAYNHVDSQYDYEYLFLMSEMDPTIHEKAECGMWDQIDMNEYWPVLWFINGRCAPDVMLPDNTPLLPHQPYSCRPQVHPNERMLMRLIGGGRDLHPFHHHGNNALQIARDGRLLSSSPALGANLAVSDFTQAAAPGMTLDCIFTWTGKGLGWDVYGHEQDIDNEPTGDFPGPGDVDHNENGSVDNVDPVAGEDMEDHGKPFPVQLPDNKALAFGATYSGSPFLGAMGDLPPGEGGMNMFGGMMFMWHSHNEKEMVNYDIFPGGLMTMMFVEPPGAPIGGAHTMPMGQ
ncbi:MAG: multicopper oxidase domain-containing protein [Sedimentisphaerales bacterium]|nr:multicopper oxidase domain-containing protein [Sedimentisphaerales bacterium]